MPILPTGQGQDGRGTKQPIDAGQLGSRDDGETTLNREGLFMSNQIPGVPEGWELVHANRFAIEGEWYINSDGTPHLQRLGESAFVHPIIRKIEKPAKYRPFANAEEYLPHWGKPIRLKGGVGFDSVASTSRTGIYVAAGGSIIRHAMVDAFRLFEFADGTPFGVRIDE
jgi:hypothetical protein